MKTLYAVAIYSKRTGCGWFNSVIEDFEAGTEEAAKADNYVALFNKRNSKYCTAKVIPVGFDSLAKFILSYHVAGNTGNRG